jgi:hypothetical protein
MSEAETRAPTHSGPAIEGPGIGDRLLTWGALLALAMAGGLAGGAASTLLSRPASFRVAVIDTIALSQTAARDPAVAATLTQRLEQAIARLEQADPRRLLLVKGAVIGSQVEDLTGEILAMLGPPPASVPRTGRLTEDSRR